MEQVCGKRVAKIQSLKRRLEQMPLSSNASELLQVYDDLYNLSTAASSDPSLLKETHSDSSIRAAAEACVQRIGSVRGEITVSQPIYERLQVVRRKHPSPELRYSIDRQIDAYRRSGVEHLTSNTRLTALKKGIARSAVAFDSNIKASVLTFKVRPEELEGLPQDYREAHPPGTDGLVTISTSYPDIYPVFNYAVREEVRRRAVLTANLRAYPENEEVLRSLLSQRAELAKLLGYQSYAHYDLANRMAATPERVRAFLEDIAAVARPIASAEASRMAGLLSREDRNVTKLGLWNLYRGIGLVKTQEYSANPEVVRRYFSFAKVKQGLFRLTSDLFGIEVRPWSTAVWAPGIEAFEMVENGQVIGRFYLDAHSRPNKYSHAAMFPIRIGIKGREIPVAAVVGNFPTGLMEHGDVVTFLHEYGHLLHWIFAGDVKWAIHNFYELESDATEAPSQLLEEWVWDYGTLKSFATDEKDRPIPSDLVRKMNLARMFGEAVRTMRELGASAAALDYYSVPLDNRDLADAFHTSFNRFALTPYPAGSKPHTSFSHLSGFGASYYTYPWSKALAVDLLSEFQTAGLRDADTAKRYRTLILARGGSEPMNTLARRFLGRDWSTNAYKRQFSQAHID